MSSHLILCVMCHTSLLLLSFPKSCPNSEAVTEFSELLGQFYIRYYLTESAWEFQSNSFGDVLQHVVLTVTES